MRKPKPLEYISLPADFAPKFCSFDEACSYARHGRWHGHMKVREGRWKVFKDGRRTIVVFASVVEDEERLIAESRAKPPAPEPEETVAAITKRRPGRPRQKARARGDARRRRGVGAMDAVETAREQWAARIAGAWRKSVEAILEAGRLLIEAKAALPHGAFADMIESDLPFGARMAQMLMAIARNPRLVNAKHVSLLPPHVGTLYELTKLTEDEFEAKLAGPANPPRTGAPRRGRRRDESAPLAPRSRAWRVPSRPARQTVWRDLRRPAMALRALFGRDVERPRRRSLSDDEPRSDQGARRCQHRRRRLRDGFCGRPRRCCHTRSK